MRCRKRDALPVEEVNGAVMRQLSAAEREKVLAAVQDRLGGRREILFAYVHGSFLGGCPYRDLDLAVFLEPQQVDATRWRRYELDLAVELELLTGQPVDVRVLNDAPVAFRYHVTKGLPLVVRDREQLDEFQARTWNDYFDSQPFARQYLREVLRS